jgi:hypothetical protein
MRVRSSASSRLTQPRSAPMAYAVSAKPTAATDATLTSSLDLKFRPRSRVRPLVGLVSYLKY